MIDIATWRARIGTFHARVGPSGKKAKFLRPLRLLSRGFSLFLATLSTSTVNVEVVTVIFVLLMLCGDVELNPGPKIGERRKAYVA